ncbi:hypothetical protein G7B40_011305 [Aetokthonos hydrillicola Thurmond2011]|uniref:Uncharacterized protein n=1 Tax=Aetokthonos hydrillicola Thurmond2011 TaxID=2712845 RepID=A0AAP5I7F8_9CYAN|nr:hypothetical protein [Aetokthonos hydrillicola]MBO3460008.1 hypothetical protein [Aetokthonos hydrillicola CCALA 1050]MBW4584605.1 hypothetical protein [Aetokthonos hydrillicola CCALA 1050]MDR9895149.1 hypothetical protein [Aetokthonos hydrillicola Thurmond2011]
MTTNLLLLGYQSATKLLDAHQRFITQHILATVMLTLAYLETAYQIYCV